MRIWRSLALATALGAAVSMPALASDGDGLQSAENEHGNAVERNPVLTPESEAQAMPSWNGQAHAIAPPTYGSMYGNNSIATPGLGAREPNLVSPSVSGAPSAAQESHATGKVDAQSARPPQTGSDVQAGDMGPSNAKAQ